ncbi:hypothetical protein A5681_11530 [Mycobacterium scrofulaceum]|nr:hypothetical protein [Mycobacterium scrofulaceum]OBH75212.1 hypothetical protein A5681_11530 [Mycobacterium scrofulaceum]
MIVAINARWKVRPGAAASTRVSGGDGGDPACGADVVQAAGTDSGPSAAASPIPADGAPTPHAG